MADIIFSPHSQQQNQIENSVRHVRFNGGMYLDGPASVIGINAARLFIDIINRDEMLEGRLGSKEWATTTLPTLRTGYTTTSTVSGSTRTITKTVGTDFTSADVGRFYIHDDGTNEVILSCVSTSVITTQTDSTATRSSTAGKVRDRVNCLYPHKGQRKYVLHIGARVYVSADFSLTGGWTLAHNVTPVKAISNEYSSMGEWQNWVFVGCNGTLMRMDLTAAPYFYFACNTPVPDSPLTGTAKPVNATRTPYCRRYVHSMTRLGGTGHRDRTAVNAIVEGITLNTGSIGGITLPSTNPVSIRMLFHPFSTGDKVLFNGVGGTTQLNGNWYTITKVDGDNFTLDGTDSSTFSNYTSGGTGSGYIKITSTAHPFSTNDQVQFQDIVGTTQLNGNTYAITKVDTNSFVLNGTDASKYTAWTSGGSIWRYTGVATQWESGTSAQDANGKDYSDVFTGSKIGDDTTTYAVWVSHALVTPYDSVATWAAVTDGRFRIAINAGSSATDSNLVEVQCNFSGAKTFADIAATIQSALQSAFSGSNATCTYIDASTYFRISSPNEGGTIYKHSGTAHGHHDTQVIFSPSSLPAGATDLAGDSTFLRCSSGEGNATTPKYASVSTVETLAIPKDASGNIQQQATHHTLWASQDIGQYGIDPLTNNGNSPDLITWLADVPVINALMVSVASGGPGGIVTATQGRFYREDVGSTLVLEDGTKLVLLELGSASGTSVYPTTTPQTSLYASTVTNATKSSQPAAIGDETGNTIKIYKCDQSGTTVHATGTQTFPTGCEGKTLYWSDFTYSAIVSRTDSTHVEVADSATRSALACAMDPVSRKFGDTIRDSVLNDLSKSQSGVYYNLQQRRYKPLPACDRIALVPSFILAAQIGGKIVYGSPISSGFDSTAGYYMPASHEQTFKDKIQEILESTDIAIIFCGNSTSKIPTNNYNVDTNKASGAVTTTFIGQTVIDQQVGILHFSAVKKNDLKQVLVITNEPAIRFFTGDGYDKTNWAENRIMNKLRHAAPRYSIGWNPHTGFDIGLQIGVPLIG